MQAALNPDIPGLHQMPADRASRGVDYATFASGQLGFRRWPQLSQLRHEICVRKGQSFQH
jgi:hypothetical protein